MKVCFLIGSADISGGTNVIFEHALALQARGHDVRIACVFAPETAAAAWHRALSQLRVGPISQFVDQRFDLLIVTWWRTLLEAPQLRADRVAYFVQSIESRFYRPHERGLRWLAGWTYAQQLPTITITDWLARHLQGRYGTRAHVVKNGIDKALFTADGPTFGDRHPGQVRMLAEGALGVPFKNVARTIALARKAGVKDLWLLTPSDARIVRGVDRVFSRIPLAEAAAVYRSCDVLLKFSFVEGMFGPPLEMFHCGGTAIVSDVFGHDEYIVDGVNALVRPLEDEDCIVDAIRAVCGDAARLASLKAGARHTAEQWPSWQESSARFVDAMGALMDEPALDSEDLRDRVAEAWSEYARIEQQAPRSLATRTRAAFKARLAASSPALQRRLIELRTACVDWYRVPDRHAWLGEDGT